MNSARWLLLLLGPWALTPSAWAQAPVAIVEDVGGNPAGIGVMDYLEAGKVIELGSEDSLVLSYLNSCVREIIHGGVVTIGHEQSETRSAHIERATIECDAAKMVAAPGRSVDAAGRIMRDEAGGNKWPPSIEAAQAPEFTLYGSSPLIELEGEGALVVARLDATGEYFNIPIDRSRLTRGRFFDFADEARSLSAGGVYGARWSRRLTVFRIDPTAKPGKTPIIGRLLRLGFAR
jgi:hypothetical protein